MNDFSAQIEKWSLNPRDLFLIDGFGALLSASLLGVVLVELESIFGIPAKTLYFLAMWPYLFAIYDVFCYVKIKNRLALFLKGIAYANILYCSLSIGAAFYHSEEITRFGQGYLVAEILIIICLALIEIRVASKISRT